MAAAARSTSSASLVLVEADSKLSNVEKDEVLGFVSDKGPEVASHDECCRPILLIEVDLDVLANVLSSWFPSIAAAVIFSASFFIHRARHDHPCRRPSWHSALLRLSWCSSCQL